MISGCHNKDYGFFISDSSLSSLTIATIPSEFLVSSKDVCANSTASEDGANIDGILSHVEVQQKFRQSGVSQAPHHTVINMPGEGRIMQSCIS